MMKIGAKFFLLFTLVCLFAGFVTHIMYTAPTVNILDKGADSSGVKDSTAAIVSALAEAASVYGSVYCPPGIYKVSTVTLTAAMTNVRWYGPAINDNSSALGASCQLKASTTGPMVTNSGSINLRGVTIENIVFNGNNTASTGLFMDTTIQWTVRGVYFFNFLAGGDMVKGGDNLLLAYQLNNHSGHGRSINFQDKYSGVGAGYGCAFCTYSGNSFNGDLGVRVSGETNFQNNDNEPLLAPAPAGVDPVLGALDCSDVNVFTCNVEDNYFETHMGNNVDTTLGTSISAGAQTVTPGTMSKIVAGLLLYVGGSNPEYVTVTSVTGTTFTATFVNAHSSTDVVYTVITQVWVGSGGFRANIVNNRFFGPGVTTHAVPNGSWAINAGFPGPGRPGNAYVLGGRLSGNHFQNFATAGSFTCTGIAGNSTCSIDSNSIVSVTSAFPAPVTNGLASGITNTSRGIIQIPSGIYIVNSSVNGTMLRYSSGETTVDVTLGNAINFQNTVSTTVNAFAVTPIAGDLPIAVTSTNTNTTLSNSTWHLCTGADYTIPTGKTLLFGVDNGNTVREICGSGAGLTASLTTTAATSDNVTVTGMVSSGHCALTPTNASAATNMATTYVSAKTTNQITVTHAVTASMTYDISCSAY